MPGKRLQHELTVLERDQNRQKIEKYAFFEFDGTFVCSDIFVVVVEDAVIDFVSDFWVCVWGKGHC